MPKEYFLLESHREYHDLSEIHNAHLKHVGGLKLSFRLQMQTKCVYPWLPNVGVYTNGGDFRRHRIR